MLMTVLKGELAIRQSKALVRTFKFMKDYIIENQSLIGEREYLQLSMKISNNILRTMTLQLDLNKIEEQMAVVMDKLSDVVTHSELSKMMNEFDDSVPVGKAGTGLKIKPPTFPTTPSASGLPA